MEPDAVPTLLRLSESGHPGADLDDKKHGLVGAMSWVEIGTTPYNGKKVKDCDNAVDGVVVHGGPVRLARVCAKKGCPVHRPPAPQKQKGETAAGEGKAPGKQQWEIDAEKRTADAEAWRAELPPLLAAFAEHVKDEPFTAEILTELIGEWSLDRIAEQIEGWTLTADNMGQASVLRMVVDYDRTTFSKVAKAYGFKMPRKPKSKKADA